MGRHCRRGARRWRGAGHRGVYRLRQSDSAVRIRAERLDQRPAFHDLDNERDPIVGNQDGSLTSRRRSGRFENSSRGCRLLRRCEAEPTFFFRASERFGFSPLWRSSGAPVIRDRTIQSAHIQPDRSAASPRRQANGASVSTRPGATRGKIESRHQTEMDNRFSTITEVRRVTLAELRDASTTPPQSFHSRDRRHARTVSPVAAPLSSNWSAGGRPDTRLRFTSASIRQARSFRSTGGCSRRYGHLDGVRPQSSSGHRTGRRPRRKSKAMREWLQARRHVPDSRSSPRCRGVERSQGTASNGI